MGTVWSGTALLTSFPSITLAKWFGSLSARRFNRLGKYLLDMDNLTNGKITNPTEIASLIS